MQTDDIPFALHPVMLIHHLHGSFLEDDGHLLVGGNTGVSLRTYTQTDFTWRACMRVPLQRQKSQSQRL